jgi:hypothetical protein
MFATIVSAAGIAAAAWGPSSAYGATVVAVWHMSDTGTTMTDSSGNGLNGHLNHVLTGQPGYSGTGFGFASKPAYITVPDSPLLDPGTGPLSITVHVKTSVKPSSSVGDYDLIRKGLASTSGGDYKMEVLESGSAFCLFRGSSGTVSIGHGPNVADNRWHTLTCSRSSNSVTLTFDGVSYTKSGSIGSISNSSAVSIGAKNTSGEDQYTGLMDEVTITN